MRGFPLLNVILVVAFLSVAWWPLQRAVGDKTPEGGPAESKPSAAGEYSLQVTSSHPLAGFSVSHLNAPLLTIDGAGDAMDDLEFGHELGGIEIPPEGIEFWIEASFSGADEDGQRPVIGLELVPADVERELEPVTLWGEAGGSKIDAPAVFLWAPNSE